MRNATKLLGLLLLTVVLSRKAGAVDVPTISGSLEGSLGQLAPDSVREVDIHTLNWSTVAAVARVTNVITFKINEEVNTILLASFQATVTYSLYFENANAVPDSLLNQTLTLSYDSSGSYTSRKSFTFYGGYKVRLKVISVSASSAVLPALVLTNELKAKVDYVFSCNGSGVISTIENNTQLSPPDELYVSWNKTPGADEYDLEWTYIDSTALGNYRSGTVYSPSLLFENNSTRVSITDSTHYTIPLLYDFGGVLFYRVRAVQNKVNGKRVEALWSSTQSSGLGLYSFWGMSEASTGRPPSRLPKRERERPWCNTLTVPCGRGKR